MIYSFIFLFVSLLYSTYILYGFDKLSENPIKLLPYGILVGSFSIFLVEWLSPANYLLYDGCDLIYYEIENGKIIFKYYWEMSNLSFQILRNYIFTGFIEEFCKLSAAILVFMVYKKTTMSKLFFYIVLSASFFAFIENIQYLEKYGPSVILIRSLVSTTTHIGLSVILGYFILKSLTYKSNKNFILNILIGIIISSFLHGSFNFTLYYNLPYFAILVWTIIISIGFICLNKIKLLI